MSNKQLSKDFSKVSGMLLYVCMGEPVKAYNKPGTPVKPAEWKSSIVLVSEDEVDELEAYAKSLDTLLSLRKIRTTEFESTYKVAPPENAGKYVWVFSLRKSVELGKTGKPVPPQFQPKVFEKVKNTMVDITHTKLVGNGSYGTISIDKFDRANGGSSLYLRNLLVTDLIEYERTESSYEAGSEFDDDSASDGNGGNVKVPTKAKAAVTTKAKAAKPQQDEDDDSSLPF